MKVAVNERELTSMLLCAFRYSLGRRTYVVDECIGWLKTHWGIMPQNWKEQIHNDIKHAIKHDMAGMDCDVKSWEEILELDK